MKTSEVLNKAADLIEERGWTTGDGWPKVGDPADAPLCLEGGLMAAMDYLLPSDTVDDSEYATMRLEQFWSCPAHEAVMAYLRTDSRWGFRARLLAEGRARAYDWNDACDRTVAEVIEVLRATAVIEAAREDVTAPVEVSA